MKQKEHPRNRNKGKYDFKLLTNVLPPLSEYVFVNEFQTATIDFFNPKAVKALNKAILIANYGLSDWNIPEGYLCPPVPGRADYIHFLADLLAEENKGLIPTGAQIKGLDIGTGANLIYPIIGSQEYGWSFVGTETDEKAIKAAEKNSIQNPGLKNLISIRKQNELRNTFIGIIKPDDRFDFTICNPPFHASAEEAESGSLRKLNNLRSKKVKDITLNFGGKASEIWCAGGEEKFVREMIYESTKFKKKVLWFTSLIADRNHLKSIYKTLKKVEAQDVKTIDMAQGNKISRFVAWTFLEKPERGIWFKK